MAVAKKSQAVTTGTAPVPPPSVRKAVARTKGGGSSNNPTGGRGYTRALIALTVLAFLTRFYKINFPSEVVFDEVHFGKFASYYLRRTYFFDVHPPFAKLLFAFVGALVGYDGSFLFNNIGDSYIANKVPYVAYRALPATLGAITVPFVFLTAQESGLSLPACLVAASIVLFDNAHIAEDRLILLDATLNVSLAASLYFYIRFLRMRYEPFSRKWWKWLLCTGIALACAISTKYVGFFAFVSIGGSVLLDLWKILDIKRGIPLPTVNKHFFARLVALIVLPVLIFLTWFQVHFDVLNRSGPGDTFMSPEFQETLAQNPLAMHAKPIEYHDILTLKHKATNAFLHSHPAQYPLRYDDGRISSQGQQVTGYQFEDAFNNWEILPAVDFEVTEGSPADLHKPVKSGDYVRLRHVGTNTLLLAHDVASPHYTTNEEFTTVGWDLAAGARYNDTLFEIQLSSGNKGKHLSTKMNEFKFVHVPTKVFMWTETKPLPDWGFKQQEIDGNKYPKGNSDIWTFDEIVNLTDEKRLNMGPREVKKMPFWKKYFQLQLAMFAHNNALTSSHPYASHPVSWPFLVRGVSFWTHNDTREQIYFIGNYAGWWLESLLIFVWFGLVAGDQFTRRRGERILDEASRNRLYRTGGFFVFAWAAHYLPFYLMGRQLFLHHYLPAHICAALVAGTVFDFLARASHDTPISADSKKPTPISTTKVGVKTWITCVIIISTIVATFIFLAPITYGTPGLSIEQVLRRQLLKSTLHFAK